MLSVAEARARIVGSLQPTGAEIVALAEASGRVLAAPVVARLAQPPHDVSAMDGFALRAADGAVGARLRVIGAAPAGHPFGGAIGPGEAVHVFTGSVMPEGADAVTAQEDAVSDDTSITLHEAVRAGRHIRRKGQDFHEGETLLEIGRRLTARDIGLAAAANHPWLAVHRRPVIAVLATGDEIAMPGETIPPGGIVSSNSHALAAFIRARGGVPIILPIAADDRAVIAATAEAASRADLLVTTGGASVGTHDLVQTGLGERGLEVDFWKIAMRPGKPLMFGHLGALPVLGVPGNPVSSLVCGLLFLKPAIERLSGLPGDAPPSEPARCTAALPANDHRADHLRATLARSADGVWDVTPFPVQDSSMLQRLALADALLLRAPNAPAEAEGAMVQVIRLAENGL
ncbi:molybdopterin molybdotransferase MoeA [Acidiphilium sp. AL]|uniref:Molybdopterin molybdenumtransferase n=1 Tax=Acidiphilium iwatense TaxID=768198 RepID=A0ABS9DWV6_9PROT|nr:MULTISPECIES: gephyrin-like molybdotransferase Glp [Acidiphilium]MCF3945809.1 molybdopterin molybdotransferase MoeA [Acidiphilium iwatense]MCU4159352.1 molybdopterin molybdotransferase MoeA [Acidiphilium sp. AL]